jgi:hypothetical protein
MSSRSQTTPLPSIAAYAIVSLVWSTVLEAKAQSIRKESDSLGKVEVLSDRLWGAQTQRSLEHFNIAEDLVPREMIAVYAILKKAAANANLINRIIT